MAKKRVTVRTRKGTTQVTTAKKGGRTRTVVKKKKR